MRESLDIYNLLSKIDWEGGIPEVLEYGIRNIWSYDVPEELKEAWAAMEEFYSEFELARDQVQALMDAAETKYYADKEF